MATIEVSVDEIIEAAEKDGYIHCRTGWFKDTTGRSPYYYGTEDSPIIEACIMGQVALNLGVDYYNLEAILNDLGEVKNNRWLINQDKKNPPLLGAPSRAWGIAAAAIEYNDHSKLPYNEIAKKLRGWLEPYRGKILRMETAPYISRKKGKNND